MTKTSQYTERVYLVTSIDKYELPLGVFDTLEEACAFMGVKWHMLYARSNGKHCINKQYKIFTVYI